MKKVTRFNAAVTGLIDAAKAKIRRNIVDNALKSNQLDAESKLLSLNDKKNELIRELVTGSNDNVKNTLQRLAQTIQEEEALKAAISLGEKVLAILDEEIEVDDSKK